MVTSGKSPRSRSRTAPIDIPVSGDWTPGSVISSSRERSSPSSAVPASAHRRHLLFARALIAVICCFPRALILAARTAVVVALGPGEKHQAELADLHLVAV